MVIASKIHVLFISHAFTSALVQLIRLDLSPLHQPSMPVLLSVVDVSRRAISRDKYTYSTNCIVETLL